MIIILKNLTILTLSVILGAGSGLAQEAPSIEPLADQVLRHASDYLGAVVPYVPDSGTHTTENGIDYYAYNGVRYQAVSMGGETEYLVTAA